MRALRAALRRVAGLFGREREDREFRDELEAHLQLQIDDNRRLGMTDAEARRQAFLRLGGVDQVQERYRDRRSVPWLEQAFKDVRFAIRLMWRSPGFTAVVLATLAVGIGANTVMFSIVNTVLLRPLPYADPSRLVFVQSVDAETRLRPGYTAAPDFYAFRERNQTLERLDAFYVRALNLTGGGEPQRVLTLTASSAFFTTLGIQPAMGRGFVPQDEQWGSHRVALVSDGLWRQRFGSDPAIVGQSIALNGQPHVVIGVLPRTFSFMGLDTPLVVPMSFAPADHMNSHSNYFLRMVGKLKPAVSQEQAGDDLNRILQDIIAKEGVNEGTAIGVAPLRDALVGGARRPVLVLLGAVAFVLLIACANLANLLLARAVVRQREISVRLALGATRRRLLRQFAIESVMLSLAGGAIGLALAYASTDLLNLLSPQVLPRAEDVQVDTAVLAFTFTVAVLTGLILGVAPAMQSVSADVHEGLKDSSRGTSGSGRRSRMRSALVVAEVALSLVLLAGAGLMVKSMYQLLHVNAGFRAEQVLTLQINAPAERYVDRQLERKRLPEAYVRAIAFFNEAVERVRSIPGVQAAGAVNGLPLMGDVWGKSVTLYDRPLPSDFRSLPSIEYRVVAGDYFRALGIPLLSGRAFSERDDVRGPRVAIVNREFVRRHWPDQEPLGKVISVNPPLEVLPRALVEQAIASGTIPADYKPDLHTVVGIAEDVRYSGLHTPSGAVVYVPYAQGSEGVTNMFMAVRTSGEPLSFVNAIREQIAQIDPNQPIAAVQTMEARVASSVAQRRLQMNVLGAFAALAILLAAIGIYGVMSYAVTQRAREIGIRLALGAARGEVIGLVLRNGAVMVAIGMAIGIAAALALTRVLRTLLYEVTATDPQVFGSIVALLATTAWLAAYLPARRAAKLDPLATLRAE